MHGEEAQILEGDLLRMFRWSQDWQMQFNMESVQLCIWTQEATHSHNYEMGVGGSKVLRVSEDERVLGVSMTRAQNLQGNVLKHQ